MEIFLITFTFSKSEMKAVFASDMIQFSQKNSGRGQKFHKLEGPFVADSSFEFQIEYLNCSRPCTTHQAAGLDGIVGLVYTIRMERNGPGQSMQCCIPSQDLQLKDWQQNDKMQISAAVLMRRKIRGRKVSLKMNSSSQENPAPLCICLLLISEFSPMH